MRVPNMFFSRIREWSFLNKKQANSHERVSGINNTEIRELMVKDWESGDLFLSFFI